MPNPTVEKILAAMRANRPPQEPAPTPRKPNGKRANIPPATRNAQAIRRAAQRAEGIRAQVEVIERAMSRLRCLLHHEEEPLVLRRTAKQMRRFAVRLERAAGGGA